MKFKERLNPTTKLELLRSIELEVLISPEAITKMASYVEQCADEIGWLGTAYREGDTIKIEDVYLFEQEVHATTTEITPEGLSSFAEELLSSGEAGIELWNNLKVWGHSHVNMGITPSGQDNSQMETFKEGGHDWFLRLIANKKGELKIDLYDYKNSIIYLDLPWSEYLSEEEEAILHQIEKLYSILDKHQDQRKKSYEEVIKEEMKQKVKKKIYLTTGFTGGKHPKSTSVRKYPAYANYYDDWYDDNSTTYIQNGGVKYTPGDAIKSKSQVYNFLSTQDLIDLSHCKDTVELTEELEMIGYFNYFTERDIKLIFDEAKSLVGGME